MSLAELQQAIAELICDKKSLQQYVNDPQAWTRAKRLPPRESILLHGLDTASLHNFHEIHERDRAYFIEAILPLTTARIGEAWPSDYFAVQPYADENVRIEAARFVMHVELGTHDEATAHLARYELAKFRLLDEPAFEPTATLHLREIALLQPAPGIAIVPSSFHLPTLVDDPDANPPRRSGVALLRRDEDGVTSAWLEGVSAGILDAIRRKDEGALRALVATDEGSRAFIQVLNDGVVS